MEQIQRFCPICDRSFEEGEAVLRCEGCGVLHHPSCWVTQGGCATQTEHRIAPAALAYTTKKPPATEAAQPGQASRVIGSDEERVIGDAAMGPIPMRPAAQRPAAGTPTATGPRDDPPHGSPVGGPPIPPSAPRRYVAGPDAGAKKQLPRIYGHHRILAYWYVPVAIALAAAVAFGVVWLADRLTGDDGPGQPAGSAATVTSATPLSGQGTTPGPTTQSPGSGSSPTPLSTSTGTGKFKAGDIVVVTGTGDCLNVRTGPARTNDAIVCLPDGSEVTVIGGPEMGGDLRWWKLRTASGEGWAAEDYLVRKP